MEQRPKPDTAPGTHEVMLRLLDSEPGGRILDMGSGEGALSLALKERGFEVWALDIAPIFKAPDIPWKQWDLNSKTLPFEEGSFDYVASVEVIEHLENPHHLIRQARKLLKGDGKLILTTPNIANVQSRIRFALTGRFSFFEPGVEAHVNPIPFWELERILSENGFVIEYLGTVKFTKLGRILRPLFFLEPRNRAILEGNILVMKARKSGQ